MGQKEHVFQTLIEFCMSFIFGLQKAVTPLLVSMFHDAYRHCRKRHTFKSARQCRRSIQIACRCQQRCNGLAQKALNDLLARNRGSTNSGIALTKCELFLWLDSLFSHFLHFFGKDDLRLRR
jgi:hypothetical protein